jgi:3-oxoacyl-[acyl-carrier protein] reductase
MPSSLHSSTALVTGAARGIGLAIAVRLARDGVRVLASDADGDVLKAAVEGLAEPRILAVPFDCRDRVAVAAVLDAHHPVQIAVNCAGVAADMVELGRLTRQDFERVLSVNLGGTFVVAQEAARRMTEGGRIINIASRGYLGGVGGGHYVASKAGVVGLTRAMAVELRWRGINVNAVAPGMVDTRMLDSFDQATRLRLERREPSGHAADPATIAAIVAFLASPDASQINGQVLLADGGKTLGIVPL